jgi:hypothetical protein
MASFSVYASNNFAPTRKNTLKPTRMKISTYVDRNPLLNPDGKASCRMASMPRVSGMMDAPAATQKGSDLIGK